MDKRCRVNKNGKNGLYTRTQKALKYSLYCFVFVFWGELFLVLFSQCLSYENNH